MSSKCIALFKLNKTSLKTRLNKSGVELYIKGVDYYSRCSLERVSGREYCNKHKDGNLNIRDDDVRELDINELRILPFNLVKYKIIISDRILSQSLKILKYLESESSSIKCESDLSSIKRESDSSSIKRESESLSKKGGKDSSSKKGGKDSSSIKRESEFSSKKGGKESSSKKLESEFSSLSIEEESETSIEEESDSSIEEESDSSIEEESDSSIGETTVKVLEKVNGELYYTNTDFNLHKRKIVIKIDKDGYGSKLCDLKDWEKYKKKLECKKKK